MTFGLPTDLDGGEIPAVSFFLKEITVVTLWFLYFISHPTSHPADQLAGWFFIMSYVSSTFFQSVSIVFRSIPQTATSVSIAFWKCIWCPSMQFIRQWALVSEPGESGVSLFPNRLVGFVGLSDFIFLGLRHRRKCERVLGELGRERRVMDV